MFQVKTNYHLPSRLTPVPAMLCGRGLRTGVVRFVTTAELAVELDIALPGREVDMLFGVISPDRSPKYEPSRIRREWIRRTVSGYKKLVRKMSERRSQLIARRHFALCS